MLQIFNRNRASAKENMDRDAALIEGLDPAGSPILHFYDWERPSATFGVFINPSDFLNLEKIHSHGIELAQRPTGGGIVFHLWDFAFSFLMPSQHPKFSLNTLENYRFVNEAVLEAMKELLPAQEGILIPESFDPKSEACSHFCMARPTQYDVVHQGRKIAGSAQRRRKQGYLHQGTISLCQPDVALLNELLLDKGAVVEAMLAHSFVPKIPLDESKSLIQKLLTEKLTRQLSL